MNTRSFKKSDIQETWILLDAKGKTLGRFAAQIAKILSGKNKPEYTPVSYTHLTLPTKA